MSEESRANKAVDFLASILGQDAFRTRKDPVTFGQEKAAPGTVDPEPTDVPAPVTEVDGDRHESRDGVNPQVIAALDIIAQHVRQSLASDVQALDLCPQCREAVLRTLRQAPVSW